MIVFATPPASDTITVDGVDYLRDPDDPCRYRRIAHRMPSVAEMLDALVRADVEITLRTDGAYGSGTIEIITEREGDGEGVASEYDYWQDETVEDAVAAAWSIWIGEEDARRGSARCHL